MKILLFCAKGFETMEFAPFVDVMGWAADNLEVPVSVVTAGFTKHVLSTFSIEITVDRLIDEIHAEEYDALAIPGGFEEYGFYEEAYDERFLNLIRDFDRLSKPIASVCVAALPVAKSGVLNGRAATTYHLGDGRRQKQLANLDQLLNVNRNFQRKTSSSALIMNSEKAWNLLERKLSRFCTACCSVM